jgi:ABC-type transport system substrate-binding protein
MFRKEHIRKVRVVLARTRTIDKGLQSLDEYFILRTPDAATRLAAFRTGQSDILWVASLSEAETVRKTNSAAVVQGLKSVLATFGLTLAQDKPPFSDVRVRRAISMAIDRQKQVYTVFEGHGILGWGVPYIYYQDTMPTAAQLGPWWQFRPAEAKKLLAEAGHPNGFETTLFYYEYFPQMTSQVQLVQQDLKKNLNINLKITKLDYTSYYGRTLRVNDPRIEELNTKLRQTPDRTEHRGITKKIVDRELDQVWRMWMPADAGFLVFQPSVRNASALSLRRTDGYGSAAIARLWLDK